MTLEHPIRWTPRGGVLNDRVKTKSGYVVIDSRDTQDRGFETMVFKCDEDGYTSDWTSLDTAWYGSFEEMEAGHKSIVEKWRFG